MHNALSRRDHRDYVLAQALGLRLEQIWQVPEYIREFAITLLLDGPEDEQ